MEPPKKKRKLLIVDIGEDGRPIEDVPPQRLPGIEKAVSDLQQYVYQLTDYYKFVGTMDNEVWRKIGLVQNAQTPEEAAKLMQEASNYALAFFQRSAQT